MNTPSNLGYIFIDADARDAPTGLAVLLTPGVEAQKTIVAAEPVLVLRDVRVVAGLLTTSHAAELVLQLHHLVLLIHCLGPSLLDLLKIHGPHLRDWSNS